MAEAAPADRPSDIGALAKGGRTNFFGFLLRLAGNLPFLFIAGRLYGAEELGRFAAAIIAVELAAQLATLGLKRGLAQELATDPDRPGANIVADAMLLCSGVGLVLMAVLAVFPEIMFPSGLSGPYDRLLPVAVLPLAMTDVSLAALAYRFDVGATVRARALVEPWTKSLAAGALWFVEPKSGLDLAYLVSVLATMTTAVVPLVRSYGLPRQWRPRVLELAAMTRAALPLAGADAVEWGTRKLDIAILAQFAPPAAVGVYYVAQQVASLPQKLKTSFEPILGPVITRNLVEGNKAAIAKQLCQVGFWITAAQFGIALALGLSGPGVMGLVGPQFVGGTGALVFLLAAEVLAAPAVVSEAALIYVAPLRNLAISLATILVQAGLTVLAVTAVGRVPGLEFPFGLLLPDGKLPLYQAASVALALAATLSLASTAKSLLATRLLGLRVSNFRWALFAAAVPTVLVGLVAGQLPEWAALSIGIPAMLAAYCAVIWRVGFGPEDRVLFRRKVPGAG